MQKLAHHRLQATDVHASRAHTGQIADGLLVRNWLLGNVTYAGPHPCAGRMEDRYCKVLQISQAMSARLDTYFWKETMAWSTFVDIRVRVMQICVRKKGSVQLLCYANRYRVL